MGRKKVASTKGQLIILAIVTGLAVSSCSWRTVSIGLKNEAQKAAVVETIPHEEGMIFIPGGWFQMGSPYKTDEQPVHRVYVDAFFLDKTEVTWPNIVSFVGPRIGRCPRNPNGAATIIRW
ncbi:MAG TPA: hypothetical protein ENJ89_03190 [Caldithrix abyssi]|uniref:Sulfatase-modifying factor enzyme-like domain-containing protein n=1 Tax=Caldithrix abyssi TaxID=187145 RepID=A0A7V5PNB6_CALAY|nr:hypothetical protein [Caldithrix abyssi]